MKAIEFQASVDNGAIKIPKQYEINDGTVKVIVLYEEPKTKKNYDKNSLMASFSRAKELHAFMRIDDSVVWQKEMRNEWK